MNDEGVLPFQIADVGLQIAAHDVLSALAAIPMRIDQFQLA
jgi:hypothetical protein